MGARGHIRRFGRRYTQLLAAVIFNCNLSGFFTGRIYKGKSKNLCVPGLNCYSCPGAAFACPLGSLQASLYGAGYRMFFYVAGTLLLFGILLGRVICGFLCPFGLIQDLLDKIPLPKIKKNAVTAKLTYIKYVILVIFVIAVPVIKAVPAFCKYICPAGTLEAGIPLIASDEGLMSRIGWLFSWKILLLMGCIIICSICYRAFCRFFCPLGAIYSLFNPVAFFGVRVDKSKCTGCNACISSCGMDVKRVADRECIHCGKCAGICPENAILPAFTLHRKADYKSK